MWTRPYSTSLATPGVWPAPAVTGGVVVDLSPVAGSASPVVSVSGVDARTGKARWTLPGSELVTDAPGTCVGGREICIVTASLSGGALLVLDPTTGRIVQGVPGIARAMDGSGLYQTTASAPTFAQLGAGGTVRWRRSVMALFGPGFTPNAGYNFNLRKGVVVGTLGTPAIGINEKTGAISPGGATVRLDATRTVGVSVATGALSWRVAGSYQCGGTLAMLVTPVLCRLTGSLHFASLGAKPTLQNVTLTLEGLVPASGAVTWRVRVLNTRPFLAGTPLAFADASHIVVRTTAGTEVLNTATGTLAKASSGATFWCQASGSYHVVSFAGDPAHGLRTAAPTFGGCTATGAPTTRLPATEPPTVGVRAGGRFVFLTQKGIRSMPAR